MDVSNYQPPDLSELIRQHNIEHVIVRINLPGERPAPSISIAQLISARSNNCSVSGYGWAYGSFDPVLSARNAADLIEASGVPVGRIWWDVEPYTMATPDLPDAAWLWKAIEQCQRQGFRAGIYTAKWVTDQYGLDLSEFAAAGVPLWAMQNDGIADPDVFTPFAGYTRCEMKQYSIRENEPDLDIMRREALV